MPEILSYDKKLSLLRGFIESGIEKGIKKTQLYNQVKGTELGIRKQHFLKLYDMIATSMREKEGVVLGVSQKDNVLYRFKVKGFYIETGEYEEKTLGYSEKELIPVRDAAKKLQERMMATPEKYTPDETKGSWFPEELSLISVWFKEGYTPRYVRGVFE